ncbi:MAG: hypothetical protein ACI898_000956 [Flavobacteriales bacterium]|jgi:hypothetical protein
MVVLRIAHQTDVMQAISGLKSSTTNSVIADYYATEEPHPSCFLTEASASLGEAPQGLTAFNGGKFVCLLSYHLQFCLREFLQCQLTPLLEDIFTDGRIGVKWFERL